MKLGPTTLQGLQAAGMARKIAAALVSCWAAATLLGACTPTLSAAPAGTGKAASPQPSGAAERPSLTLARIDQLIGAARCDKDSQCRVAAIGDRPCGGAEGYRAWSTASTEAHALEEALRAYAEERRRWHEKLGLMSTCEIRPSPAARCERPGLQPGVCALTGSSADLR